MFGCSSCGAPALGSFKLSTGSSFLAVEAMTRLRGLRHERFLYCLILSKFNLMELQGTRKYAQTTLQRFKLRD